MIAAKNVISPLHPGITAAMGLLVTAYTAGTAGGPALGGWLFDRAGLPGLAAVMTLCGLVGAGLAWRALRRGLPRENTHPSRGRAG